MPEFKPVCAQGNAMKMSEIASCFGVQQVAVATAIQGAGLEPNRSCYSVSEVVAIREQMISSGVSLAIPGHAKAMLANFNQRIFLKSRN